MPGFFQGCNVWKRALILDNFLSEETLEYRQFVLLIGITGNDITLQKTKRFAVSIQNYIKRVKHFLYLGFIKLVLHFHYL